MAENHGPSGYEDPEEDPAPSATDSTVEYTPPSTIAPTPERVPSPTTDPTSLSTLETPAPAPQAPAIPRTYQCTWAHYDLYCGESFHTAPEAFDHVKATHRALGYGYHDKKRVLVRECRWKTVLLGPTHCDFSVPIWPPTGSHFQKHIWMHVNGSEEGWDNRWLFENSKGELEHNFV
ncbi:hypothetical protein LTR09_004555 [Extremus antarcticus]|uniref:Uncharacterized protein n=1 Tax=Extremus antarcticus TaxID=702011 RepID=A0AAJ0DPD7_9PEZI|nr:hypothetical protein LTR09_004555 [Extremus antarcticus]